MKLATCEFKGREWVGVLLAGDEYVLNLGAAERQSARRAGRPRRLWFTDMLTFLETGPRAMQAARELKQAAEGGLHSGRPMRRLAAVRLRAPVPRPRKVLCLAGNYQDHIEESGGRIMAQDRETPRVFMKPPSTTVVGPGDAIQIPPVARAVDWEGELAVVIGRSCKGVRADAALRCVAGYTVMNDVSERRLRIWERSESRERDKWFDWLNGKWFDTFAPQGPWLVTTDEIPDPQTLDITTRVNGALRQRNNTGQMLLGVAQIIEYVTAMLTLEPGDIISTGTIAGVGAATGEFLQSGDQVEIEISRIGVLRNPVRASAR